MFVFPLERERERKKEKKKGEGDSEGNKGDCHVSSLHAICVTLVI
jgi:hypothetical protein